MFSELKHQRPDANEELKHWCSSSPSIKFNEVVESWMCFSFQGYLQVLKKAGKERAIGTGRKKKHTED